MYFTLQEHIINISTLHWVCLCNLHCTNNQVKTHQLILHVHVITLQMIQSNSVPAEQARESKLSPSSVGSCTLQPSSSSFRTALTSPSRQASARLRAPGLKHQRANSSKTVCLAKTTAHVHECGSKKTGLNFVVIWLPELIPCGPEPLKRYKVEIKIKWKVHN